MSMGRSATGIPAASSAFAADEEIFSGPQVDEKLTPFKIRGVLGDGAGVSGDQIGDPEGTADLRRACHVITAEDLLELLHAEHGVDVSLGDDFQAAGTHRILEKLGDDVGRGRLDADLARRRVTPRPSKLDAQRSEGSPLTTAFLRHWERVPPVIRHKSQR